MNKTLSRYVILALLCLFYSQVYAVPAKPGFTSFTQSDGSTIQVQALGDEFCHSLATSDGLIIGLGADGDYYYQLPDGITNVRVHNVGERTADELAFLTANGDNLTMSALIESRERKGKMRSRRAPAAPLRATQVPNNGSPRVPIILVQYTDKAMSNTKAQFVTHYTSLGTKSVRQYFVDQSNGLYDPQFDVYGIYTLPSNRATYGGNDSNGDDKGVAKMVGDAISKAGNDIDWSQYDNDGDGEADVCIVVYAGVGEAQAYGVVPNAVWPCQWNLTAGAYYGDGSGAVTRNGTKIDKFAVFNEVNGSSDSGTTMDGIGTFCHEFSHCLGLPDFYETTYRYGYYGMGGWSLMNSGSYNGITIDGDTPIGYSAYEKNFMGWIDYITPVENTYYTLPVFNSKTAENDQAVKITALNANEYWILENRKQQGWDACIADEGVLITHFTYVADRWTANTVNNQSVQLATIIPADNQLTEATENADLYGESKHEFTTSSTPAMKANMSASGSLSSSTGGAGNVNKPVTEITLNNDGTASFWYIKGTTPSLTAPVLADASSVQRTSFVATWTHTPSVSCTYTLNVTQGNTTVLNQTGITNMSYTVTGLEAGKTYTFKVKAVPVNTSQATESAWSNVKTVTLPVPTITATPTSLSFGTVNVGENGTASFTVTGVNLEGNITASLTDANGVFSLSSNSITPAEATQGKAITVTYAPNGNGNFTGTVTLASSNAQSVTVSLTGTGHVLNPTINVSPDALTLATYVNEPTTQTFTVTGSDLSKTVYVALQNDDAGVFSLSQGSISASVANGSGREITVTFSPTTLGDYTATVRLTSTGADTKYVTLNASAVEHVPALTVTPQNINFGNVEPGGQATQTFTLNGEYLMDDVTLTLNDANGVFSLSDASVTKADAEAGKSVTVSFSATEETSYTGSITVSTSGLQNITIALSAEVSTGGTASDAYLDIAKYATIDEAGWSHNYVDNIYKYTEYADDGVAWLTLPVYGAWTGYRYTNNAGPQKWIKSNISTTTTASDVSGNGTWNASDIHLGSSQYFTNTTAKYFGNTSTNARTERTISFYVTNVSAVKLLGKNNSSSQLRNFPTTLKVYVCTENADGTLTESSTAASTASNTTSNASFNLSVANLDETKIYKVVASYYRAQFYEIGFQTALPSLTADPVELDYIAEPNEIQTQTFVVTGNKLSQNVTVALTDPNSCYSVSPTTISAADAMAGATVTVTFNAPVEEGSYRAQVTLTSGGASANVGIFGSVGEKGSAFSRYLDIQKYPSIGLDNWYEGLFDKPYDYTEDLNNNCAWLTIPALMSYAGFMFNDQNWTGVSRYSNYYSGLDWDATDVFKGNTFFYGNNTAFVIGSNSTSTSNTQIAYMVYNVTNCSQIKAYCYNNNASSSYPAIIQIYELTENADGTLTSSDSYVDNQITSTQYGDVTVTSATLDPNKIYEVLVAGARSFFYEVAFKTPIPTVTLADVAADGNEGQTYRIVDGDIRVVYLSGDGKKIYCKDDNAYANPSVIEDGQIDYVRGTAGIMTGDWDQSNWVALQRASGAQWTSAQLSLMGHNLKNVRGTLSSKTNPVLLIDDSLLPSVADNDGEADLYLAGTPNVFVATNFLGGAQEGIDGNTYFFVQPKPMELAVVMWAMWDGEKFVVPTSVGQSNQADLGGGFYINPSEYEGEGGVPTLVENHVYNFLGLIKREQPSSNGNGAPLKAGAVSGSYTVYPISGIEDVGNIDGGIITNVNDIKTANGAVEVARYNISGQRVTKDTRGIVFIKMSDGSVRKVIVE